ncbi:MAG: nucleotidyltransferase domain-containing protein [Chloroflexi bacterium]|nr:nucleotidyltransferase domain-containing protein [Chloroflexota bacterium]
MLGLHLVTTTNQKVLRFLVKFSDREFYERQIARKLGIAYGSANNALNELYSTGVLRRRQEGKMYFYSVDASNPIIVEFKKLVNLLLIESLVEELKAVSDRVVLYGSCAQGTDTSASDVDLFVASNNKNKVLEIVSNFKFPQGFEYIHIQVVVKTPVELLKMKAPEQAFIEEVERGIVLWERAASESRV